MVLIALSWFLSQVIRMALSRSRELLADAGSVELTKNPDAMISALRKIENRGELPGATSAVMEMCVDNPRQGFADLFATHPSIETAGARAGDICRRPRSRTDAVASERAATDPKLTGEPDRRRTAARPRRRPRDADPGRSVAAYRSLIRAVSRAHAGPARQRNGRDYLQRHQRFLADLTYRIEFSLVSAMVPLQATTGDTARPRDHTRSPIFSLLKGVSWRSRQ